jgi:hypothetical protein
MCALALLAVATARPPGTATPWAAASTHTTTASTGQPGHWRDTGKLPARPGETPPRDAGLIRITVPEAHRLFALLTPPANQVSEILRDAWSIWRRRHQARARWHHYQTRLQAAAA